MRKATKLDPLKIILQGTDYEMGPSGCIYVDNLISFFIIYCERQKFKL